MNKPLYKKVDHSLFFWGITIPKSHEKDFVPKSLKEGNFKKIQLIWDKRIFDANLWYARREKYPVYQIRWDNQVDLLEKLRTTFVHSYVIIEGNKEVHRLQKGNKQFRTELPGGQQEVLIVEPVSSSKFKLQPFIKIDSPFNPIFERLVKENVFGWIFSKDREHLFSKSMDWIEKKDLTQHVEARNVIYYLADTRSKELYIGSAKRLGDRVKLNRKEIRNWNKFRYDIIKPQFAKNMRRIEEHTIRAIASLLKNKRNTPSLKINEYSLVNSTWSRY